MISSTWVSQQKSIIDKRRTAYIQYLTDDFDALLKSYPNAIKSFEKVIRDIDEVNAMPPSEEKNERLRYLPNKTDCENQLVVLKRKLVNIQTLKDAYKE